MNRQEFIEQLEKLLTSLPENEREEALQYYREYFEDAGPEREAQVIWELGSPEKVAREILSGKGEDSVAENLPDVQQKTETKKSTNGWKILAIVLLCLLAAPFAIPLGIAGIFIVLGIVIFLAMLSVGVVISGVGVFFAGLVMIGAGLTKLFLTPAVGLAMAGAGFLLIGLGILLSLLILWCCIKWIPGIIRWIVRLLRRPFQKGRC